MSNRHLNMSKHDQLEQYLTPVEQPRTDSCPICYEDWSTMPIRTPCEHEFHKECLEMAVEAASNTPQRRCPTCRQLFCIAGTTFSRIQASVDPAVQAEMDSFLAWPHSQPPGRYLDIVHGAVRRVFAPLRIFDEQVIRQTMADIVDKVLEAHWRLPLQGWALIARHRRDVFSKFCPPCDRTVRYCGEYHFLFPRARYSPVDTIRRTIFDKTGVSAELHPLSVDELPEATEHSDPYQDEPNYHGEPDAENYYPGMDEKYQFGQYTWIFFFRGGLLINDHGKGSLVSAEVDEDSITLVNTDGDTLKLDFTFVEDDDMFDCDLSYY